MNERNWDDWKQRDHFGRWLGYEMHDFDPATRVLEASLVIREDHLSQSGRVHGGVIAAFLDTACGAAVYSTLRSNQFCSTVELKVNYFRPLNLADDLRARAEVAFRGNRLAVVHARLYRQGEQEAVAMATGTFNIVTVESAGDKGPWRA